MCLRHAELQDVLDVHEDHPQRLLYAAIRVQEDLQRYSDGPPGCVGNTLITAGIRTYLADNRRR